MTLQQLHKDESTVDRDFAFSPMLETMIASGRIDGPNGTVLTPTGLASPNTLLQLRNLCLARKPQRTLEVGLAYGSSSLVFAQSHVDLGHTPRGQHVAMDPFQQDMADAGLLQLERAGHSGFVRFYREPSHQVLPRLLGAGEQFDLCFIDGSHLFEDCFLDGFYCGPLLAPNGVMIFDDTADPHVAKVTSFIDRNMAPSLASFDLSPFRPDGGWPMKYRLARALGRAQLKAYRRIGDPIRAWNAPFGSF